MLLRVGLELNYEGRDLAWALDFPGCFAYGASDQEALLRMPQAFVAYQHWVNLKAGDQSWLKEVEDFDVRLIETFKVYDINDRFEVVEQGDYSVNVWFQSDWLVLTEEDVQQGVKLMDWSRADLIKLVAGIPQQLLEKQFPGERWNILGILKHIGAAEWWYLERLGLTKLSKTKVPADPFERLEVIRTEVKNALPQLVAKDLVVGRDGEFWSPRKLLRRVVWHEKDHIQHIYQLISEN